MKKSFFNSTFLGHKLAFFIILTAVTVAAGAEFLSPGSVASAIVLTEDFDTWEAPINMESIPGTSSEFNTIFNDGCPIQAPDGLSFYMASNRPGGLGGQDIWAAYRSQKDEAWGTPVNLGAPVNSNVDDFCPTPVRGHGLFFVSARIQPGSCGGPDMYFTKQKQGEWEEPQNLGCGINSAAAEWSPSYFESKNGDAYLYFSSTRPGGFDLDPGSVGDMDIYYSLNFGTAELAQGLNTASDDSRPNVRKDGREIVFDSNRPGTLGGPDIWTAARESVDDAWLSPAHLPAPINSSANETRASLSWNGEQMVFGSNRAGAEGQADIFLTTRQRLRGNE